MAHGFKTRQKENGEKEKLRQAMLEQEKGYGKRKWTTEALKDFFVKVWMEKGSLTWSFHLFGIRLPTLEDWFNRSDNTGIIALGLQEADPT